MTQTTRYGILIYPGNQLRPEVFANFDAASSYAKLHCGTQCPIGGATRWDVINDDYHSSRFCKEMLEKRQPKTFADTVKEQVAG